MNCCKAVRTYQIHSVSSRSKPLTITTVNSYISNCNTWQKIVTVICAIITRNNYLFKISCCVKKRPRVTNDKWSLACSYPHYTIFIFYNAIHLINIISAVKIRLETMHIITCVINRTIIIQAKDSWFMFGCLAAMINPYPSTRVKIDIIKRRIPCYLREIITQPLPVWLYDM